ncbi:MAG: hypothetical protein R2829_12350 [Bacteroidia bacterium]
MKGREMTKAALHNRLKMHLMLMSFTGVRHDGNAFTGIQFGNGIYKASPAGV